MLPGSDRVPCVNSSTSASQLPLRSGLMVHLTTMKIMDAPFGIDPGQAEARPGRNCRLILQMPAEPRSQAATVG
jgi:hypothetical protein